MVIYYNPITDPYYNLALEEILLKQSDLDFMLLWSNKPTVVCGKHQNIYAELQLKELAQYGVLAARRLSGGGAVFHDLGNLNFTFICNTEQGKQVDFGRYLKPIEEFLQELGVDCYLGSRNDLFVKSLKFSGNAEHVFKNRVLHHGTLLFDTDLDLLRRVLRKSDVRFRGRGIGSVRSEVGNLQAFLPQYSITSFREALYDFLKEHFCATSYLPTFLDIEKTKRLANEKYGSYDWVFAYSPNFEFKQNVVLDEIDYSVDLKIKAGIIDSACVCQGDTHLENLNRELKGLRYHPSQFTEFSPWGDLRVEQQLNLLF
jgi:lipoate-protein ligase A